MENMQTWYCNHVYFPRRKHVLFLKKVKIKMVLPLHQDYYQLSERISENGRVSKIQNLLL